MTGPDASSGPQPCLVEALPYRKDDLTAGYRPDRFSIDTPYAVLVEPDGSVRRIVIEANARCPAADYVVGLAVQGLARAHKFRATHAASARWYGGRIRFEASPQRP